MSANQHSVFPCESLDVSTITLHERQVKNMRVSTYAVVHVKNARIPD
jgi:hypothetical protein